MSKIKNIIKIHFLEKKAKQKIKLDQDLILLSIISSLIAVFGVKLNNIYILIGSMLISPLFNPVISSAVFLVSKNYKAWLKSLKSLLISLTISILSSLIFWFLLKFSNQLETFDYLLPNITLLDTFGVAVLMGVVGTLLWIWPKIPNTSAGVSISISLVPPIASLAAGLVFNQYDIAIKHSLVLLLNLLGILIGSILTLKFYFQRNHKDKI
jgi:uncharacterized hydrophobic protein (TIGR00271 family)